MTKLDFYNEQRNLCIVKKIPKYFIIIISSYLITLFSSPLLNKDIYITHTIMELLCIFIGISTFFIMWHSYGRIPGIFRQLGFGLLSASIFYSFHTYTALSIEESIPASLDLPIKLWSVGMLVEALTILDLSLKLKEEIADKWRKLAIILIFSFGFSFALLYDPDILPALYTHEGITSVKLFYDLFIIALCLMSLYNLKKRLRGEHGETYRYILLAVLFIIPSQLCFLRYDNPGGLLINYSHVLRVICYYCLYRAAYACSIEFPYKKLKEAQSEREKANTSQRIDNGLEKEQEIKLFDLQIQKILDALSNSILIIDRNKKIIFYNEAFKNVFEIDGMDITGMDIAEFHSFIGYTDKSLAEVIDDKRALEHPREITMSSFKGNKIELLSYMAPITNAENEVLGAVSISTDITGTKLHKHIIQQQAKLALVGQMAAGIVHEIKNPLATIKGLSQLISAKSKEDKVKKYTSVIDTAINDITEVVNEFLNFAKPKPTVASRTTINKIVESMQLITETQCYTKNIKSSFHYSPWPMEITADETKIKQVILNIIENAIHAMENAGLPELVVRTYYDTDSKEGVISITDNGMGMSSDVLTKLGIPFFTTKEKGTGLGLGISYEIMREHKGRIEVDSKVGKGTSFKIIFTQIEDLI